MTEASFRRMKLLATDIKGFNNHFRSTSVEHFGHPWWPTLQLIRLLEPAPIFLKPDTNISNTSKVSFAAATNKIRTQTLLLVLHLISSLYRSDALNTVTLCFSDGICSNIRCFLNEHEAKSFTADLLLITISSSDMAHPCCSQGALLSITSSPSSTAASIYNQTLTQWQMMS